MTNYFEGYTTADAANEDLISIKRAYIDLTGCLTTAAIFTQIMWWHGRTKDGKTRLRVERENEMWIAKSYDEWAKECHITARAARDAIKRLTDDGLIIKRNFHFAGKKTVHVRVDKNIFEQKMTIVFDTKRQIQDSIRHKASDTSDIKRQIDPPVSDIKRHSLVHTDSTSSNTTGQSSNPENVIKPDDDEWMREIPGIHTVTSELSKVKIRASKLAIATTTKKHGSELVLKAIEIAVMKDKRTWAFVVGCLQTFEKDRLANPKRPASMSPAEPDDPNRVVLSTEEKKRIMAEEKERVLREVAEEKAAADKEPPEADVA